MKSKFSFSILFLLSLIFISFIPAGDDCEVYFPAEKGTVFEITNFDHKGEFSGLIRNEVLSKTGSGGNLQIKIDFRNFSDEKATDFQAGGVYEAKCEDGLFKFQMGGLNTLKGALPVDSTMEMVVEADFFEIPRNPVPGQMLEGGKMTMRMNSGGIELPFAVNVHITNRKVEAIEKKTTPAGTFDCVKISYDLETKTMISITTRVTDWFSKDVGLVRSETRDQKGKLMGYSELTRFSKP